MTISKLDPIRPRPIDPPTDRSRWTALSAELDAMPFDAKTRAIDVGRSMVAELKPGEGYFVTKGGAIHIGPWDAVRIRLPDGTVAGSIGQSRLPR